MQVELVLNVCLDLLVVQYLMREKKYIRMLSDAAGDSGVTC